MRNGWIRFCKKTLRWLVLMWKYRSSGKQVQEQKKTERVLVVTHSLIKGGAPVLCFYMVKELIHRGYNVDVVALESGDMRNTFEELANVFIISTKSQMKHFIKKRKYMYCIVSSALSGNMVETLKKNEIFTTVLIHEMPDAISYALAEKKAIKAYKFGDRIIFPSSFVRERFEEAFISEKRLECEIMPQGLFLTKPHQIDKAKSYNNIKKYLSKELDLSKPVVLAVGSTSSRKGFDIFIDMAIHEERYNFVWIGFKECNYSREVEKEIKYREASNLYLVGYIDNPEDLSDFYDIADIYTLTSREEPFGSVVLEAFNAGLPVVAFDKRGGYIDIVENGKTGVLVKEVSSTKMLIEIKRLLEMDAERELMSKNGKRKVSEMTFDKYIDKVLERK